MFRFASLVGSTARSTPAIRSANHALIVTNSLLGALGNQASSLATAAKQKKKKTTAKAATSPAAPPKTAPTAAATARYSDREILRRARAKQNLRSAGEIENEQEHLIFPRQRVGLDYDLNWTLVGEYGVAPRGDAHRNASVRRLLAHATHAVDPATKALVRRSPMENKAASVRVVGQDVSESEFADLFKRVRRAHLSDVDALYVQDSEPAAGFPRVRIITDSPVAGLHAHLMLPPPLALGSPLDFDAGVVVFVAETGDQGGALDQINQLLIHPSRGVVVAVGQSVDYSVVLDQVAEAMQTRLAQQQQESKESDGDADQQPASDVTDVIVRADCVSHEGRTAVIFNTPPEARTTGFRRALRGRHHIMWSAASNTVRPLWAGASFDGMSIQEAEYGSLAEPLTKSSSGGCRVTVPLAGVATPAAGVSPDRLVFVSAEGGGAPKQVKLKDVLAMAQSNPQWAVAGYGADPNSASDALARQLTQADKAGAQFWTIPQPSSGEAASFERAMVDILLKK